MISTLKIKNLFGRFDYELEFKKQGVTIITGPNGYGKSTILKIIEALSNGRLEYFFSLDFKCIEIELKDNVNKIRIEKSIVDKNEMPVLNINGESFLYSLICNNKIKKYNEEFIRNNLTSYNYKSKIKYLTDTKCVYEYGYGLEDEDEDESIDIGVRKLFNKRDKLNQYVATVNYIRNSIGKIHFIKEQRLMRKADYSNIRHNERIVDTIAELPKKLTDLINNISSEYSSIANRLDSTYPNRLFDMEKGIKDEEEFNQSMDEMNGKFDKLNKYDISEIKSSNSLKFKEEHSKALKIYFDDFNKKYKVYEDFIRKLDLFTDIINARLSFKKIKISREDGIKVVNSDNEEKKIELTQLSSGEKQEIVLFYELIFETDDELVILIDEPEISLHIVWQQMFMDDLLKIVEYKRINVIVATHSASIISNHWDIQIDLGELYGNEFNKR